MQIIKWIFIPRHSLFGAIPCGISSILIFNEEYLLAFAIIVTGAIVNACIEALLERISEV